MNFSVNSFGKCKIYKVEKKTNVQNIVLAKKKYVYIFQCTLFIPLGKQGFKINYI